MTVDVATIRKWQEELFVLRFKAESVGRNVSRLTELAALGGPSQGEKLLEVAHLVDALGAEMMALASSIRGAMFVQREVVQNGPCQN